MKYEGTRPYIMGKQEWRGGEMVGREVEGRGISWACLSRKSLVRADLKEWSEGARKRTVETVGGAVRMTRFTVVWRGGEEAAV